MILRPQQIALLRMGLPLTLANDGGGGNQQTQNTQTTQVTYSPQEQAARDKIMSSAMGIYDEQSGHQMPYAGPRAVGPSGETQQAWQAQRQGAQQIQGLTNEGHQANQFGLHDALYADSNPYLQNAMQAAIRPMVSQFQDAGGTLSQIRGGAVQDGAYGGSRQGIAEGLAAGRLGQQIGDVTSNMASAAYTKGLDVQQSAIKNQSALALMSQMPGNIMSGIGAQRDAFNQQAENAGAAERQWNQNAPWAPLQNLANIIYGGSSGSTTSTGTSSQPKPDTTMQGIGTVGSLALMAMML